MLEENINQYKLFNESITEERRKFLFELASAPKRGGYEKQYEWQKRRQLRIKIANFQCEKCQGTPIIFHVHHLCYDRYGNENWDDLQVLCEKCHILAHQENPCLDRKHVVEETNLNEYFSKFSF